MTFIQKSMLLLALIWLQGCGEYFVLSTPSTPQSTLKSISSDLTIGVEEVRLPKYLFKREIAVANSRSHVSFLSNAQWAEDLDEGLTRRLVAYLQRKLNTPRVFAYPWGVEEQPRYVLLLTINQFVKQNGRVYLDAAWQIRNTRTQSSIARRYQTEVVAGDSASEIVDAMDRAFMQLEEAIGDSVATVAR